MLALDALGTVDPAYPAGSDILHTAIDEFLGGERASVLGAAASAIYDRKLRERGARVFLDKTPRYTLIPDLIRAALPTAKRLCIVRNPLDIAASYLTTWNTDIASVLDEGTDVPVLFDFTISAVRVAELTRDPDVLVCRYEDLVRDPGPVLARAHAHLGLLAHNADPWVVVPGTGSGSMGDPKILTTHRVHSASVGIYGAVLSEAQIGSILSGVGRDVFEAWGYAETYDQAVHQIGFGPEDNSDRLRRHAEALRHARTEAPRRRGPLTDTGEDSSQTGAQSVVPGRIVEELRSAADERLRQLLDKDAELQAVRAAADERLALLTEANVALERLKAAHVSASNAAEERLQAMIDKDAEIARLNEACEMFASTAEERLVKLHELQAVVDRLHGAFDAHLGAANQRWRSMPDKDAEILNLSAALSETARAADERLRILHLQRAELTRLRLAWESASALAEERRPAAAQEVTRPEGPSISPSVNPNDARDFVGLPPINSTALFCRTYYRDADRLRYMLRSIDKYCSGFSEVVIATPTASLDAIGAVVAEFKFASLKECTATPVDFIGQQITKMTANRYTDADMIVHVDSDCVFTKETRPEQLRRNGRPIMYYAPYQYFYEHNFNMPWQTVTSQFLRRQVEHEFMRQFPLSYPRTLYDDLSNWYEETYQEAIENIIHRVHGDYFSEFNLMGSFSFYNDKRYHEFVNVLEEQPEDRVRQFCLVQMRDDRSISDDDREALEALLR